VRLIKESNWKSLTLKEKLVINAKYLDETDAYYSDKLRVKKFVEDLKIPELWVLPTIKVLTTEDNLDLNALPNDCIIKSNNGCGDLIIIKNRTIDYVSLRANKIPTKDFNWQTWKFRANTPHVTSTETHYGLIKPEVFAEELLPCHPKAPEDYKFFCFHGDAKFSHVDFNRHVEHTRNFYDRDANLLDVTLTYKQYDTKINKSNYLKMMRVAEKLSSAIEKEFVRVDLYEVNDKIYFGEYTFVPDAGYGFLPNPPKFNEEAGDYWR